MVKLRISESQEQINFVAEVMYRYKNDPEFIEPLFFNTLNGAWIGGSSRQGKWGLIAKYKAEGFRLGISDLLYLQPRGEYAYLAIEMKAVDQRNHKDGGATENQIEFLKGVERAGGLGKICYGCDASFDTFVAYMNLPTKGE